ncbi:MAG: hypothetical protein A2Y23_05570 [Clostridiales bacterium GWB2_37_7]|nr:MAG: hypothetical protein A2Y23_05570 [Clostridiales bacterium GWB2_37_7]
MKKFLSLLLIVSLLFTSFSSVFAQESADFKSSQTKNIMDIERIRESIRYVDMEKVNSDQDIKVIYEKLNDLLYKNYTYDEIEKTITNLKEYKNLSEKAKLDMNTEGKIVQYVTTDEYLAFEERVNKLANEYLAYYKEYGELPNIEESNVNTSELLSTSSFTNADAVAVFSEMGYTVSEPTVALLLAEVAVAAGLAEALPVIVLIAIVGGVVIVADWAIDSLVESLYVNRGAVSAKVSTVFSSSGANNATNSIVTSRTIRRSSSIHYLATLNPNPPGGIWVNSPVTTTTAITTMKTNQFANIYSPFNFVDAFNVALGASTGSPPKADPAHINTPQGYRPANLPHYHATLFYVPLTGHSFY